MKHLKLIALIIGICATLTACDSDNKVNSMETTITNCFLRVTEGTEASAYIAQNVSCNLFVNYDAEVIDVTISNFQASTTSGKGTLAITGLPWAISTEGSTVINQPVVASNGSVTDFKLDYLQRSIPVGGAYIPSNVLRMSFTLDNRYDVVLYQEQYIYVDNSTTVTTIEDGATFTPSPNTQYVVNLNPQAMTADIYINGAQFAEQMRPVQMTFKSIPLTFVTDGYILRSDALIPESANTPYPQFAITGLNTYANLNGTVSLSYTCGDRWRVLTNLRYLSPSTSSAN